MDTLRLRIPLCAFEPCGLSNSAEFSRQKRGCGLAQVSVKPLDLRVTQRHSTPVAQFEWHGAREAVLLACRIKSHRHRARTAKHILLSSSNRLHCGGDVENGWLSWKRGERELPGGGIKLAPHGSQHFRIQRILPQHPLFSMLQRGVWLACSGLTI